MKKMIKNLYSIMLAVTLLATAGCEKFLAEKSDKKLVVPAKLADLQALLDNYNLTNYNSSPGAGEVSTDDYFLTDADWAGLSLDSYRRMYTWEKDNVFTITAGNDWSAVYGSIYYANTVLNEIKNIERTAGNDAEWRNVKGQALALRANCYLDAVLVWALAFDENSADRDLGLPLRLDPDFNKRVGRSTVRETYMQILTDLKEAVVILPNSQSTVLRANKTAGYGLLARTYLAMRRYKEAGLYADSCLSLNNKLIDFNTLNAAATYSFTAQNVEVVTERGFLPTPLNNTRAKIDLNLYNLYAANDLRKSLFFKNNGNGSFGFRGSYEGNSGLFNGIASDEMYLTRAECFARDNKPAEALSDLNTLLRKRWKAGTYTDKTPANTPNVLDEILLERRKELLMRGLRWMDIKRLNKEGKNISMKRVVNGQTYTMAANDLRFALNIPEDVITISGMIQNPR